MCARTHAMTYCFISVYVIFCAGRILNRFSKDLGFLDDRLPYIFLDYLTVSFIIYVFFGVLWK